MMALMKNATIKGIAEVLRGKISETTEEKSKVLPYSKQKVKNEQIVATAITGVITLGGATIISINTRKRTRNEQ